jgi:hypothetical protein
MAMTEQEWLACEDSQAMLESILPPISDRKLRLLAVGCVHQLWNRLDQQDRVIVTGVEQFADGMVSLDTPSSLYDSRQSLDPPDEDFAAFFAWQAVDSLEVRPGPDDALFAAIDVLFHAEESLVAGNESPSKLRTLAKKGQCRLVRCIFGNPFRPVTLNPAWQTSNVTALAQSIYDERAFDRLPILADALEDAGCDNADILNHCRQPGEHVRGCWVVDLLLGKE